MDYLLDPFIVQMPKPFENKAHLIEYLTSLSNWCSLLVDPKEDTFWFSAPALEELWNSGQFPGYSNLLKIFEEINDNNLPFDPTIVSRAFERLNTPPYIDDEVLRLCPEVNEILLDENELSLIPDEIRTRLKPKVAEALILTFTKLAFIHKQYNISVFNNLLFATRALDEINEQVELRTRCFHFSSGNYFNIEDQWRSAFNPCRAYNIEENWIDTTRTIEWAFQDLVERRELDLSIHELPPSFQWCVGKHFNDSIIKNHFNKKNTLVEIFHAVVKVLVKYWGSSDHDHNKRLKKDSIQVTRKADGAFAWRTHVTNEPDMLRLHYWVVNGNQLEFSNVVFHNDFCID